MRARWLYAFRRWIQHISHCCLDEILPIVADGDIDLFARQRTGQKRHTAISEVCEGISPRHHPFGSKSHRFGH